MGVDLPKGQKRNCLIKIYNKKSLYIRVICKPADSHICVHFIPPNWCDILCIYKKKSDSVSFGEMKPTEGGKEVGKGGREQETQFLKEK